MEGAGSSCPFRTWLNKEKKMSLAVGQLSINKSALLKSAFRQQEEDFTSIMAQMLEGKEVTLPGSGETYSLEEDMFAFILAANRWMEESQSVYNKALEIYKFEGKLMDEIRSAV